MQYLLEILRNHAPTVVFVVAFLETLGFPIPAFPFLVLTGCLIVEDSLPWIPIVLAALTGALAGDQIWYWMGRRIGRRALGLICRFSLNPDACMDRSQTLFRKRSIVAILFAKLVPGINAVVPPLSGIMGMRFSHYILLDAAGCFIWIATGMGLGVFFGRSVLSNLAGVQYSMLVLLLLMIGFYVGFRIVYQRYLIRRYAVPRIEADVLRSEMASEHPPVVLDLRNEAEFAESGRMLPDARRVSPGAFERFADGLPRERLIVLYCT